MEAAQVFGFNILDMPSKNTFTFTYREMARSIHTDKGGSKEAIAQLNDAKKLLDGWYKLKGKTHVGWDSKEYLEYKKQQEEEKASEKAKRPPKERNPKEKTQVPQPKSRPIPVKKDVTTKGTVALQRVRPKAGASSSSTDIAPASTALVVRPRSGRVKES